MSCEAFKCILDMNFAVALYCACFILGSQRFFRTDILVAAIELHTISGECNDGLVRLVNGRNKTEGRLEVCHSGQWGTVCDDSFSPIDAGVACRQLGYGGD